METKKIKLPFPKPFPTHWECTTHDWETFSTGSSHVLAIKKDGSLWAWGENNYGQLGNNSTIDSLYPIQIGHDKNWTSISAGYYHSVALKKDGTLWAWGNNESGQLGVGTILNKSIPQQIGTAKNWLKISAGGLHTLALKKDNTLWSWGDNSNYQLGNNSNDSETNPVHVLHGFTKNQIIKEISAGQYHNLILISDGTVWEWGSNAFYGLGVPFADTIMKTPTQLGTDNNWAAVSAGYFPSVALKMDGSLWVWGHDEPDTNPHPPTQNGTDLDWKSISAGFDHSVAIKNNGTLWAWEVNHSTDKDVFNIPVQIGHKHSFVKAFAGRTFSVAIDKNNALWAWGSNEFGQLGDGTTTNENNPENIY